MRILIVDDSAMMRRLIVMSLSEMSSVEIETIEAVDGVHALENSNMVGTIACGVGIIGSAIFGCLFSV